MNTFLNYQEVISSACQVLITAKVCTNDTILGCTPEQLADVERDFGRPLPAIYRAFLERMGCGAGRFYRGTHYFYPEIRGLNSAAVDLLRECGNKPILPANALVFSMHQGYQFLFMSDLPRDDPAVYHYHEGGDGFELCHHSFSNYLLSVVYDNWGTVG